MPAQEVVVEYPYNPDFENDGNVGVEDLMQLLASFGMGFDVDEITIDEVVLSEWLQAISETLVAQQALIDSLMSNEANSGMGQLDSALIADMINEAGFATASFGERVVLKEFQETTSQGLEDWFNEIPLSPGWYYGEFDFDTDGVLHLGLSNNAIFDIAILPDSISVEEIAVNEIWNSLIEELWNERSWSIALQEDEKLVFVSGYPDEHADILYASWLPLESASSNDSIPELSTETVFQVDFEEFELASIPTSCSHLIINPPVQLPLWEVKGYGPSGFTQLYAVSHESVIDTITQVGIYDVTEIQGYTAALEIDLDHFDSDEVVIEWGDVFDWYTQILPSLEFFHSALGDDNWTSDNIAIYTPMLLSTQTGEYDTWGIRLVTQNVDYSTVNGPSSVNEQYEFFGDSHIGVFRKTTAGFWLKFGFN